jgi:hypothetical protein
MSTKNLVSVERSGFEGVAKAAEGRKAYQAPDLFAIGTAIKLVQGNQLSATYRDVSNSGYTYWGNM